ncbi:phospho-acceptor domain-containing protein [Gillisia sp. Hel_I_86]|uniref:sensor histidine kinase n=1 Tax=Gillisia sp. Hel_I_86 TaxID=1249981 RepID=UPI00119AAA79|nr:HAMP domain-containing sensor histidine kinase [Gillisia sp. Hel_I_86]TVZ25826.1 phospho-acceptor domain-containing protein [Gillisia sp. Hel_I_86]
MKTKFFWLITVSIVVFIALSSIQGYLIYNTYTLKRNAFIEQTRDRISKIDYNQELDSILDSWGEELKNQIADYKNGRITKKELLYRIKLKADTLNDQYYPIYKSELQNRKLGYAVNYKKNIKSIVIFGKENDTIFPLKQAGTFRIFGADFPNDKANSVSVSRTFSQYEFINQTAEEIITQQYNLEIKAQDLMQIIDEKSIVFKQMTGLLVGSTIIFLAMVGLFYYSLKTLIKQKKINTIKTDFINNITHELKTPLATLGIATKGLKVKEIQNDPKAITHSLAIIDRQNDRIQKLIDQVMSNSLHAESIPLQRTQVLARPYLEEVLEDFKMGLQHRKLTLKTDFFQKEVLLRLDKFYFTTALFNLLDNAIKYSEEPIEIMVKTTVDKNQFTIAIQDQGIGISKMAQKHLFDKFYRVPQGDVYVQKGLGLGLYYTQQIVKAHHGEISVESEPGKGSAFLIKIPLDR